MALFRFVRSAFAIVATSGILAGCGGGTGSPNPQSVVSNPQSIVSNPQSFVGPGSAAQLRARGLALPASDWRRFSQPDHRHSWMAGDATKTPKLLYVADEATNNVYVYSYPSGKLEGTLTGFNAPSGMCSNKAGDVFILNGGGSTVEVYAHGGHQPLRTLDVPGYPELNCSVDPKTGNLALGVLEGSCGDCIAVFPHAKGIPITYKPSGQDGIPGCGYDNEGNLFCDAYSSDDRKFELLKLAKGSSHVTTVSVSGEGLSAGPVQWDGEYLAVGSGAVGTLYQIKLSGSTGTVAGSTQLDGTGWVWQFWIAETQSGEQGTRLIGPTYAGSDGAEVGYWNYPAGGNATKAIVGSFQQPDGATLSTIDS